MCKKQNSGHLLMDAKEHKQKKYRIIMAFTQ